MARDLSFWKTKEDVDIKNSEIYMKLSEGEYLDCIADLPIKQILQDLRNAFVEWENVDDSYFTKGEAEIQLFVTEQFVRADCYSVTEKDMNKIIDTLLVYDCPLYDSLIDVRFDEEWTAND